MTRFRVNRFTGCEGGSPFPLCPPTADVNLNHQHLQRCAICYLTRRSKECPIRSPRRRGRAAFGGRPRGIRGTGFMEFPGRDYSGLIPANLTTLPHFSVSSTISLLKSAGEPASTVPPRSTSRALILGSARPALISLLSLSTTSMGVFLGAPTPNQVLAS